MIRPGSEIEYPPSEALCTKARMIARMDALAGTSGDLVTVLAERVGSRERQFLAEIEMHAKEQERLVENMKRMLQR